ncbi:hypothetical protein A3I56_01225 [Candidatus Roizmanbacteria bacterium RIFCSPLOWO2_02_FULL_43_10]|uniref:Uncharacterized protein n=2 Tax=Microgenomates group TaxID=1794810 RepID=A0A1F7JUH4_9BACT|nr:MAG: hypothetical protein A2693_05000 [Candidatus Curtissbacteria bacterium RIFCSPHIGHO2_01_FULL_40_12]OGK59250.1 MAG: hypothetical protein A3I56_01225 [Candidatus Roizmanbacteria bacterium RIFCSPLOWO2_02_FULL_43_10]
MVVERTVQVLSLQEVSQPHFSDEEVTVVQGRIDGWSHREFFRTAKIGGWEVSNLIHRLEKRFAGKATANGFFMAIKEMIRQNKLNLEKLPQALAMVPDQRDLAIWASMYRGDDTWKACRLVGCRSGGELYALRNKTSKKLGFENPYQAVAWWARERQKLGAAI